MKRDTVRGLQAAIEAILAGLNQRHERQRRDRYDLRAEEDQDMQRERYAADQKRQAEYDERAREDQVMQREQHQAYMGRYGAGGVDALTAKLGKVFSVMSASDTARQAATEALLSTGDPNTAMAQLQAELQKLPKEERFVMPPPEERDWMEDWSVKQKEHDSAQKATKERREALLQAISGLQLMGQSGAMGQAQAMPSAPAAPTKIGTESPFDAALKAVQSVHEASMSGDPMRIKAADQNLQNYLRTHGSMTETGLPNTMHSPTQAPGSDPILDALRGSGQQFIKEQQQKSLFGGWR